MNEVFIFGQSCDIFLARNEEIWFFDGGHFGLSNMAAFETPYFFISSQENVIRLTKNRHFIHF